MAKDVAALVGYAFEPHRYVVERGKIQEFVRAIGDDNPIYADREAAVREGFWDTPIPPTFPTVVDMWGGLDFERLMAELKLDPLRVLHGEQEYEYLREVYPGDEITARTKVNRAVTKRGASGGLNLIELETAYENQRGETVLIARATIVERQDAGREET